ncbi:helix-turn-helix domain-containing protein [Parabacteroides sp. PF5-6]|uniref:helix-turn-helix domain-containing protein n=1 Tax=Parabacteroides sp. PF5-6 TaxID=1742403 RepID=UPI002406378A|nr:helix-turn-helix domain-containing protein [Parabacteroides sp. PF5-6]MDF9831365.1 YesN/AraC family two-component response regulator [Parabacteroides sp. PF5-6]
MIKEIALFLPSCTALLWSVTLACRWKRNLWMQHISAVLLALLGILLLTGLCLITESGETNPIKEWKMGQILWFSLPLTIIFYLSGYLSCTLEWPLADARQAYEAAHLLPYEQMIRRKEENKPTETTLPMEFDRLIYQEKIYLKKNLNREEIAKRLQTNRTYISALVREEYQCGFSEFINRLRIEHAQELMHQHPELNQEELAAQTGFTHPSAFSRTFKQYTGTTFRQYQKSIL